MLCGTPGQFLIFIECRSYTSKILKEFRNVSDSVPSIRLPARRTDARSSDLKCPYERSTRNNIARALIAFTFFEKQTSI